MEKLSENTNALNWFEIPATDITRAQKFYETIFDIKMQPMAMEGVEMAMFPSQNPKSSGAIAKSDMHVPAAGGSVVYLNANPDLQVVLDKIEGAGGKIKMGKMNIGENGFMAFFHDSEGNTVGLHSGN